MKVGLLTFHRVANPGAFFQTFASQELLVSMGHEVTILDYRPSHQKVKPVYEFARMLRHRPGQWRDFLAARKRERRYQAMARKNFRLSPPLPSVNDIAALSLETIVIGSDIVWNYTRLPSGADPAFFGAIPDSPPRIAWACSAGNADFSNPLPDWAESSLAGFRRISVRDARTRKWIHSLGMAAPVTLCDPAFHLGLDGWLRGKTKTESPYLAVYALPEHLNPETIQALRRFAHFRGWRLKACGYSQNWTDKKSVEGGPDSWLAELAGAEAIFTNTFHGSIFSQLLGKPWMVQSNPVVEAKVSSLLDLLDLPQRLGSSNGENLSEGLNRPPEDRSERIHDLKQTSRAFLEEALS